MLCHDSAGRRSSVTVQAGLLNKGIDRGAGRPAKDRATVERGERSQVIGEQVAVFVRVSVCQQIWGLGRNL